jgi:hypothetical protein
MQTDEPGPGSFVPPGALSLKCPGFTPFGSSGGRTSLVGRDHLGEEGANRPGPGDYALAIDIANAPDALAASTFKSKTQRFVPMKKHNGPESYDLPSYMKSGKPKKYAKGSVINNPDVMIPMKKAPPSIPTRHQSTGYEVAVDTGDLVLQDAVDPGFDGTPSNMVGPGDYEPRLDLVKYPNSFGATMRGVDRGQYYKSMEKAGGQAPGPGYYNYRGCFDDYDNSDQTNMIVRLNVAKKKLSASFASKSTRDAMLRAEVKPKTYIPGPGQYNVEKGVPTEAETAELKKTNQNFLSGGPRFQENMNATKNAPAAYALKSDFDQARDKIVKSKKLRGRSGWAQNISFDNTEKRFFQPTPAFSAPPPGMYDPQNFNVSHGIPKQSKRTPGFGSHTSRSFEASERNKVFVNAQEQLAKELEEDIRHGIGPGGMSAKKKRQFEGNRQGLGAGSAFGVGLKEPRFSKSLEPVGPPPGAYDTRPKWEARGAIPFKTANPVISRSVPEIRPGPGDYILPSSLKYPKPARKNIMISTGKREGNSVNSTVNNPGPGSYKTAPNLLRKSYNILLNPE